MLKCVDRIRDKSGKITHYILDSGSGAKTLTADKVRLLLKKNGDGYISNLKLSSDNKILYSEAEASAFGLLDKICNAVAAQQGLSMIDFKEMIFNISRYTKLPVKVLTEMDTDVVYSGVMAFGPFVMKADYRNNESALNWRLQVFNGNNKSLDCLFLDLSSNEMKVKLEIKDKLDRLTDKASNHFNVFSGVLVLEKLLLDNYKEKFRRRTTYTVLDGVLIIRLCVWIADVDREMIEIIISNRTAQTVGNNYMLSLSVLGKPVKLGTHRVRRFVESKLLQKDLITKIHEKIADELYYEVMEDEYKLRKLLMSVTSDNDLVIELLGYEGL